MEPKTYDVYTGSDLLKDSGVLSAVMLWAFLILLVVGVWCFLWRARMEFWRKYLFASLVPLVFGVMGIPQARSGFFESIQRIRPDGEPTVEDSMFYLLVPITGFLFSFILGGIGLAGKRFRRTKKVVE